MNIGYFLENYSQADCFVEFTPQEVRILNKLVDWKRAYIYILCVDNQIVYIGYSGVIHYRLKCHQRHIKFDTAYIAMLDNDMSFEDQLKMERQVIDFANPILNDTNFTAYEKYNRGGAKTLEYILGYMECMDKFKIA